MKEMNEIDAGELKKIVGIMNKEFDAKIKMVGAKKSEICTKLRNAINVFIEEDTTDQLPEEVVDFFNENLADEEEEEVAEEKATGKKGAGKPASGKKAPGKPTPGKKDAGKKTPAKKESTRSKFPREKSVVMALKKGGTYDEVVSNADSIYVENGGESNKAQSKKLVDRGIKYLEYAGVLTKANGKYTIK